MGASQKYPDMDRDAFEFNENVSEHKFGLVWIGLCSLMIPGLSKDIRCHMTMFLLNFANHQIRHQATHKVGCLPDDSSWSRSSASGVCAFQLCMFLSSQELKFHILYFWLKTITCCKNQSAVKVLFSQCCVMQLWANPILHTQTRIQHVVPVQKSK